MTTRRRKPKVLWQVAEFDDPIQKTRFFTKLDLAVDYVLKIFPYAEGAGPDAYDEPCLRAWIPDTEGSQYVLFITNGGLVSYAGFPRRPSKEATIKRIQDTINDVLKEYYEEA